MQAGEGSNPAVAIDPGSTDVPRPGAGPEGSEIFPSFLSFRLTVATAPGGGMPEPLRSLAHGAFVRRPRIIQVRVDTLDLLCQVAVILGMLCCKSQTFHLTISDHNQS